MQELSKDTLKFNKEPKFPFAKIAIDATLTLKQINTSFIKELKSIGFIISGLENENSEFLKAEKRNFDFFQSFANCLRRNSSRNSTSSSHITSIVIHTRFSEINKFERLIDIMGISGKKQLIISAIEGFFKRLRVFGKKIRLIRIQDLNSKLLFKSERSSSFDKKIKYRRFIEEETSVVDITNKEASTFHEIYRILSQENYEIGKSVKVFVNEFKHENMDIDHTYTNIPNQLEEILNFIGEISQNFHCYYNLGDKQMAENKLMYSKSAVEKFIFNKIYTVVYELYNKKYEKENSLFNEKQQLINKNMNYNDIMVYLEVRFLYY